MKTKNKIKPQKFLERDISWMYFNHRILLEAQKETIPLLERLTFLGIYSNNLDEFFRVRVATLNRIMEYNDKTIKEEKDSALHAFKQINKLNARYSKEFEETFHKITGQLKKENIYIMNETELSEIQQRYILHLYNTQLNGSTIPLFISSFKHLGDQPDEDLYLAIRLSTQDDKGKIVEKDFAIIQLPTQEYGRFIRIPDIEGKISLMFLDDVIRFCLPFIFRGMEYNQCEAYAFKFTKDAEMELDTDLRNGVMQKISKGIKSRKKGEPIRLVYDARIPADLLKHITKMLHIDQWDTRVAGGRYHNMKDLMKFPDGGRLDLKYSPLPPIVKSEFTSTESILDLIRQKDLFLHYPYHSFSGFLRVLREAAISKDVKSIKMTLYRLAKNSKVVKTLISAAKNGKKVTVVIELLARFDEASNINWSKQMQDAGIQVIFGVEGLKIHSKLVHISSKKGDIACISTGNFHEGNAAQYTDVTLMTARKSLVKEVNSVFTFIEKPYTPVLFKELLVSPNDMRRRLISLINKEIKNAQEGKPAYILGKINHITDKVLIQKLYEAAVAGVKINFLVRGNCSIITNIQGISENIRINGIIDRYLEHSRIFIFANGGNELYYMGSADWMTRNFDTRIEVVTPVYDKSIQQQLKQIIEFGLQDTAQGRIVDGSGKNLPWTTKENKPFRSQQALYEYYRQEAKEENSDNHNLID
ncbi:RNA degradosome polyphosphate kinase [Parabacteroides pacaensis]|uniref:RNA degradosome polyphosphate kinase n=1 Tax=Parabacteroides pacaensis TaxID=2086575 RepID=UPI000D103550|nr:RNA degradosome polyphosphate kinase [Parabacteroides pacaensis]